MKNFEFLTIKYILYFYFYSKILNDPYKIKILKLKKPLKN